MTTDACRGAKASITGSDGVWLTPIVERLAPVEWGCVRALPLAHLVRDPWRACRFCPGRASHPVQGDDDRLDLSATHRLYSIRLCPHGRECYAADSPTGRDSRCKTAAPAADPNKEASHANRSRLPDEREAGKRRRESRVYRPGVLLLFSGMPSAFHGEPATVCVCSGRGTARTRWRRGPRARLMNAVLSAFANRWRPARQWIAGSGRGAA
jgi:hypothetical protein